MEAADIKDCGAVRYSYLSVGSRKTRCRPAGKPSATFDVGCHGIRQPTTGSGQTRAHHGLIRTICGEAKAQSSCSHGRRAHNNGRWGRFGDDNS
jgi:hypothetical protein